MTCTCGAAHRETGLAVNVKKAKRLDPQGQGLMRRAFVGQMNKRFGQLKKDIWRVVVVEDAFGLSPLQTQARQFAFPTSSQKVDAFMAWLIQQQKKGILQVQTGRGRRSTTNNAWTDTYISAGYASGIQLAGSELASAGVDVQDSWIDSAFNRPIHADAVGLVYTRTFSDLKGITDAMDSQISRELAEAIGLGKGAREVARAINNRVDAIGIVRARTLARTELARAHHKAAVNGYREAGADGVKIVAEFLTTGDDLVCPECEAIAAEGKEYSLDEAESLVPVHPNCRCATKPVVTHVDGIALR
jgi:SPP1 gp7 family putative phage head morphogenesis protein